MYCNWVPYCFLHFNLVYMVLSISFLLYVEKLSVHAYGFLTAIFYTCLVSLCALIFLTSIGCISNLKCVLFFLKCIYRN